MTTTFLPHPVPRHLSHSQAETLGDCSLKYYLGRVVRVPEAPNMAAVGGKGTHLGTEMIDRFGISEESFRRWLTWQSLPMVDSNQTESPGPDQAGIARARAQKVDDTIAATAAAYEDCAKVVRDLELPGPEWKMTHVPDGARRLWEVCFSEEIEQESEHAPEEFRDPSTWRVFGSKSKAYPDKENRAWWNDHGPLFLLRWINFRLTSGWELPLLDDDPDQPAIEIDCSGMVGDIEIKGYIDRIMLDPRKTPRVVDIKSNSRLPTKSAQLGLYSVRLAGMGFPRPLKGNYWWTRSGDLGPDISLSSFSEEEFAWQFRGLKAIRDSGFFTPNTKSITCSYCGVKRFCEGQGGDLAHLVPKPWESPRPEVKSN